MASRNYKFINLAYLDKMSGGDRDTKVTLIEMLIEELSTSIPEMSMQFKHKRWKLLRETSHKMKSTLAFVGNSKMSAANHTLLIALRDGKTGDHLLELLRELKTLYPDAVRELQAEAETL